MDLCWPMPDSSLGNSRYLMVIVDEFSRMYFVYFLKEKSETLGYFLEFKNKYENRFEVRIKS